MNFLSRGIRNVFRNLVRSVAIVFILGLSIGLSLVMLIARNTVQTQINKTLSSIGNTITIQPAGFSSVSEVNNSLTTSQLSKLNNQAHIVGIDEILTDHLVNQNSSSSLLNRFLNTSGNNSTNLISPITIKKVKRNFNNQSGGNGLFISGGGSLNFTNFSPPIQIIGSSNPSNLNTLSGNSFSLTSGSLINGTLDNNQALVGSNLALRNNLKVGSTFQAYGATLKVAGIYTSSTLRANAAIIVSLPTLQSLSGQSGDVTSAVVTIDSLTNLNLVTNEINNTLGSSNVDLTSSQEQANQTIQPLNGVKSISLYSLIGGLIASGVVLFMTTLMIVRERKKEIGILKAIGFSNIRIMLQFIVESLSLTVLGIIIALILGIIAANPITSTLISSSSNSSTSASSGQGARGHSGGFGFKKIGSFENFSLAKKSFRNIHAEIGYTTLLVGVLIALGIALITSILGSYLISKIRPADVIRSE
ncbi:MAG: FtsX-like permease family protein [Patescibacteria group bacterium]|nr:FtsX-like permease family protein [Patescibacteria group bacterium]